MTRKTLKFIAIALCAFAAVLLCGGITAAIFDSDAPEGRGAVQIVEPDPSFTVGAATAQATKAVPAAKRDTLTKATIKLTVKTTDKACFGSAGCNVTYEIRAAIAEGVDVGECDVTYEVRGLEDAQVGTLHVTPDGRYTQDSWQNGSTKRSSAKLTATVTEIECE